MKPKLYLIKAVYMLDHALTYFMLLAATTAEQKNQIKTIFFKFYKIKHKVTP